MHSHFDDMSEIMQSFNHKPFSKQPNYFFSHKQHLPHLKPNKCYKKKNKSDKTHSCANSTVSGYTLESLNCSPIDKMISPKQSNGIKKPPKKCSTGCVNCKTRKVKCSEERPQCWNCARMNKECVYIPLEEQKRQRRLRKMLKKSGKAVAPNALPLSPQMSENVNSELLENNGSSQTHIAASNGSFAPSQEPSVRQNNIQSLDSDSSPNHMHNHSAQLTSILNDVNHFTTELTNDINDKFSADNSDSTGNASEDTNNSESKKLETSETYLDDRLVEAPDRSYSDDFRNIFDTFTNGDAAQHANRPSIIHESTSWSELRNKFEAIGLPIHEIFYLRVFYEKASYWVIPFAENPESNVANNVLFYHITSGPLSIASFSASCLAPALIAIAAKYTYNVTGEAKHKMHRDNYLKSALLNLANEFDYNRNTETLMAQKIESLILTILLLAMFSSSTNIDWKVHLQGAKDIFLRYSKIVEKDYKREETLALSKVWFVGLDGIAHLLIDHGGSSSSDEEFDTLADFVSDPAAKEVLVNMKISTPNHFNLLLGCSTDLLLFDKSLVRYISLGVGTFREKDPYNKNFCQTMYYAEVSRRFVFYEHEFGKVLKQNIKPEALSSKAIFYKAASDEYYSFFDISQQVHVELSLLIYFVHVGLGNTDQFKCSFFSMRRYMQFMFAVSTKGHRSSSDKDESICDVFESSHHLVIDEISRRELNSSDVLFTKYDFRSGLDKQLRGDFRLMMFLTSVLIFGKHIDECIKDVYASKNEKCKIIAFYQSLYQDCGCESAKSSLDVLISSWQNIEHYPNTIPFA